MMFIRLNKRKAQSTLEYGVVIAVIVAALVAMQVYIKRGMQGRLRQAADDMGEQFSPDNTTATITSTSTVNSTETVFGGVNPTTSTQSSQTQTRTSTEQVAGSSQENWLK